MEIQRASTSDDKLTSLAITWAANASPQPLLWYQGLRMASPLRRRAAWWLLREGGQAVATLLCYDLTFAHPEGGRLRQGFGFGSVSTLPEARRQGFASALCRAVADDAVVRGRPLGLLFSAIPPALYERLGFAVLPAWDLCCDAPGALAASGPHASLTPIDPLAWLPQLSALYDRSRPGWRLHRDEAGWRQSFADQPTELCFVIGDAARFDGYVRLALDPHELEVMELVAPDPDTTHAALRAVAALGHTLGAPRLRGWMEPEQVPEGHFIDRGRARTLPMMSGLAPGEGAWFVASDHF